MRLPALRSASFWLRGVAGFEVIALAQTGLAGVGDGDEVEGLTVLDAAVGALDEAVLVDAREAAERRDEADVRAFRRLDRADASVVGGVHVADFEAGSLTRKTTGSEGGEAALVRDLRERVGLVHELRELGGAEELADGGHDGLGVDEVVRHGRRHLLIDAHLFLDGAFHADEADAELVLHQLADRADAAVAQVIDVVDDADVLAQLEQVADGTVEVLRREGALVEALGRLVFVQLDVEFQSADAREVVLARIEEHAFEERGRGVERRRIARTQLAVDLDQGLFGLADGVAAERVGDDVADVVALGEEDLEGGDAGLEDLVQLVGGELLVGFVEQLAGGHVDDVGGGHGAVELAGLDRDRFDLVGAQGLHDAGADLLAGRADVAILVGDGGGWTGAEEVGQLAVFGDLPGQLAVGDVDGIDGIKSLQNFFIGAKAERAQEDGAEELALAVDADVEGVLLVVLKLDPAAAVGDDLAEKVGAVVGGLEEDAGRAVELRDDDALGAVDDEGAVLAHQRDVAEEDFLLLHVAQGLDAGFGVLVVDLEPDGDLERGRVGHAALFALGLVVLQLQADGVAALGTEVRRVLVVGSAEIAEDVARVEGVGDDHVAAVGAGRAQVIEALEVAALALPVADREVDELELGDVAEVGDREDAGEDRLETVVLALLRELVHLEEALVAAALDLDQVRDLNGGGDLGEVETAADGAHLGRGYGGGSGDFGGGHYGRVGHALS